jgi:uncharacterized membrane protein
MQSWIKYSIIIAILYAIWTIMWESLIKNNKKDCYCLALKIYLITGIIVFIFLIFHAKLTCKDHNGVIDLFKESKKTYLYIILISLCILLSTVLWVKAIKTSINAGFITTITNMSVIIITLYSAYRFKSRLDIKHLIGILITIYGAHLVIS